MSDLNDLDYVRSLRAKRQRDSMARALPPEARRPETDIGRTIDTPVVNGSAQEG